MKQILKYIRLSGGTFLMAGLFLTSCIGQFEKWNIDPNEVTDDQMGQDNLKVGAYFTQMEKNVVVLGDNQGGRFQVTETMSGDIFSGYVANVNTFSYVTEHNDHYKLWPDWYNAAFEDAYKNVMQPWKAITENAEKGSPAIAMATVVKVLAMSRITDMYGPIPYSEFGTAVQVAYDSQKDVYYRFFEELDESIRILTAYSDVNSARYMEVYDYIYNGDVSKWIKFANTLRLRLAMRISFVDESKAIAEASAAMNHSYGLMASAEDSAILHQSSSFSFENPNWCVSESFHDTRMGATMDCYMNGYQDPRISCYFRTVAKGSGYHGVQNGMLHIDKGSYVESASGMNYEMEDDFEWMNASEAGFLLAEAKLRLGLGTKTVQEYYEEAIRTSFACHHVGGAEQYIANSENLPLTVYVDPVTEEELDVDYISQKTIAWDEDAYDEEKLERIMIQKWIALYPNGQEAWSEMRRTGYPRIVQIAEHKSTEVAKGELISRLKFPTSEYSNNTQNTQAAVALLGGKGDIAGTRLWWDVRR